MSYAPPLSPAEGAGWEHQQEADFVRRLTDPAILVEGRDCLVVEATPAFVALLGRKQDLRRRSLAELVPELAAGVPRQQFEAQLRGAAGIVDLVVSTSELKPPPKVLRLLLAHDVTHARQERKALRAANDELEAFTYSISHDLRAPLRAIEGFSRALLDLHGEQLDPEAKELLLRLREGSERMSALVADLLMLSRVARAPLRRTSVDLSALAWTIIGELRAAAPTRRVDVTVVPDAVVDADPNLMRIALTNLLDNAWKFTSKNTRAHIEFGRVETRNGGAYFVRDDGAGFPQQYAHRLFGAFARLHEQDDFDGTGIGLATVRRIIRRHGGEVWAEGAVDRGATFYFTVP